MQIIRTRDFLSALALLASVATTPSALAQATGGADAAPQAVADSSGWGVQCNNTGDRLQCAALMNVVSAGDGQRILSVSLQESEGDNNPTLIVQLPLGLNLPRGIDLSVDGGTAETYTINTCLQTGCFVVQEADQSLIDQMIAGETLSVVMESSSGDETQLDLSLAGFSVAIDRLN